ncbi:hypothetical protein ACHAXA_011309 [Cyclostephanos tholiformis]|uniref:Uncharacterized protein n=1 Tax=Cyclostephanos tholiformis TaxID=382380 RepID=A0ABD3RW97_9STRA
MMVPSNNNGGLLDSLGWFDSVSPQNQEHANMPAPSTNDLLGFDAHQMQPQPRPQPQQQQQQHVINANHATVSIVTTSSGEIAPSIVGLGKIEPSAHKDGAQMKPKRKIILVPTYSCNAGLDTKFNQFARHARPSHLHGLLTAEEYEREIMTLNDKIKTARAKSIDVALLASGALMVPLALWGVRHGKQVKRKRRLIEEGVWEFNDRMTMDGRNLRMIWNRSKVVGGGESYLTIEEIEMELEIDGERTGVVRKKFD